MESNEIKRRDSSSQNLINNQQTIEKVLNCWLTLQKIIKEKITLEKIIIKQEETYKNELNNYYMKYYDHKIKTRETFENVIHIDNNRPIKYFELAKHADTVLKDAIDPIQNLFILMRGNVDFILKLVSIIDERETGKELDINTIVDLFCHQFYENLLIPNPEQEDLLLLIYLLLEREISNMNSASVASFIDDNSTFIGKFLKSYTKKQELKTYLSMTLGSLILDIENSSDNCLDLNPTRIKTVLTKTADEFDIDNQLEPFNLGRFLTNNIEKSSINIDKPMIDEEEEEEEEEDIDINEGQDDSESASSKNIISDNKDQMSKKQCSQKAYNENYSIDINQDELNTKIQKETDQDLRDFYLRQLERINKDTDTFTNKKFIQSLEQFGLQKIKILFRYKSNFIKIKSYIDKIIQSLIDKITTIPYALRCICKVIHMLIKAKFVKINTYERNAFIGEFIFGKCILPILINSDINIVVTSTMLSLNTRQCLKIIAKVLTKINRGLFFEANIDTDYTIFNHYIIEVIPLINTFYSKLIDVELPQVLDEMIRKHIANGLNSKNMFKELNKKKETAKATGDKGDNREIIKPKAKKEGIKNIHCCICYSIEDIMILMNLLTPKKKEFSHLTNGSFFEKTIEKIANQEYNLIEAKRKSTKRQFFIYFKEPKPIQTEEVKRSYTMLTDDEDSELVLQRIKYCITKVLTGLNLINNKDYSYFNAAKSNKCFFAALRNTLQDLDEFSENELSNAIPLRWYSQYISNNKKSLPEAYIAKDYEKLFTELLEEEKKTLTLLKEKCSIIIASNGMNICFADKIIEKARRDFFHIKQIERFMKMEKFINNKVIEVCIKKEDYKEAQESKGFLSLFSKKNQSRQNDEDRPKITVTPISKCNNKSSIEDKQHIKQIKDKGEYHIRYVKDFITVLSSFKEANEDIEKGYPPKNKIYLTLETYLEIIKAKMKKEDLFKDDMEAESKTILEKISDHIMKKMYKEVFPKSPLPIDIEFHKKTKSLGWVTPAHLEIKAIYVNELTYAIFCIRKIDEGKSAYEKLNYISMGHHSINNTIKFSSGKSDEAGQDEFSPIIQYIIIKANPVFFYSNIFYIKAFLSPGLLDGKYGFLVAQMESAAEYILKTTPQALEKAKDEFEQRIKRDSFHRKQELCSKSSN